VLYIVSMFLNKCVVHYVFNVYIKLHYLVYLI